VKHVFCAIVRSDVGEYLDLLNDVSTANYERAVTCGVAKQFFSLIESSVCENSSSMDALVLDGVRCFVSATTDEEETVLRSVIFLYLLQHS